MKDKSNGGLTPNGYPMLDCPWCHQMDFVNNDGTCAHCGKYPDEPELIECPHCNSLDPGINQDGTCQACGVHPDEPVVYMCPFCDEETATSRDDQTCIKCGRHEDEIRPVDDRVLSELKKSKDGLSFGELAEKTHMLKSKSKLSYHLGLLLGLNAIGKEKTDRRHPIYYFADEGETDTEVLLLSYLKTDNFKQRSEEEIQNQVQGIMIEEKKLRDALTKLELQDKITRSFDEQGTAGVAYYQIPFWKLPNDVCHHCREKIEKHQLAVSYTMTNPAGDREEYPIHATCRPHLHTTEFGFDTSESCCDYCGLHLRASEIAVDTDQKIVQSAMETLFDEPFSVLFSYHDIKNEHLDFYEQNGLWQDEKSATGKGFENVGLAHFVTINGKKYHPYCARQDAVVKKRILMENSK